MYADIDRSIGLFHSHINSMADTIIISTESTIHKSLNVLLIYCVRVFCLRSQFTIIHPFIHPWCFRLQYRKSCEIWWNSSLWFFYCKCVYHRRRSGSIKLLSIFPFFIRIFTDLIKPYMPTEIGKTPVKVSYLCLPTSFRTLFCMKCA